MRWADISDGTPIGPHSLALSAAANERYWRSAGAEHVALASGCAYPLIAANATVLAWLATCDTPMIQTRQHLVCHRGATTPIEVITTGSVRDRFDRRGREYVTVGVEIATDGQPLWTSEVDFTPTKSVAIDTGVNRDGIARSIDAGSRIRGGAGVVASRLTITDELIRRYSRRGNYHSDADTASELGLPGLVAQGTQVCGPAYALMLHAWGEPFLEQGEIDLRFVDMVLGGDTVEAIVALTGNQARLQIWNVTRDRLTAFGSASLTR